ncbi:MAG: hypothetical protein C5B57_12145 [Blastocatellia bacterium]|nr:MAG: hypothetical protein C5B57_12145 [Blastocatellia bacterium]
MSVAGFFRAIPFRKSLGPAIRITSGVPASRFLGQCNHQIPEGHRVAARPILDGLRHEYFPAQGRMNTEAALQEYADHR